MPPHFPSIRAPGLAGVAIALFLGATNLLSGPVLAQSPPPPPLSYGKAISLSDAQTVLDAAQQQAAKMGYRGALAVVGPAGELIAFRRLDGAGMAQSAQNKAFAAAVYRRPTKAFQDAVNSGNAGILTLPNVIASEGGLPLASSGAIIGAVGASGGSSQEDGIVAAAGAAALKP
jgi:glc operon protein GlcG